MNKLLPLLLSLGALSVSAASLAFPFLESWHDPADGNGMGANGNGQRAGGGGIYGTGSRQDWGILCSDCHVREAPALDRPPAPPRSHFRKRSDRRETSRYSIDPHYISRHAKLSAFPAKLADRHLSTFGS
jgi:hypothetical protein